MKLYFPATRARGKPQANNRDKTSKAIGLIAGCVQQVMSDNINSASTRLLERQGWRVHLLLEPACCGAIEYHLGKTALADKRFRQNISGWIKHVDELGLEALIANASGCGTMLKDYGHLFWYDNALAADAGRISDMTRDIAEFLAGQPAANGNDEVRQTRFAYQSPCSMQHSQKTEAQPLDLLKQAGFTVQELPEKYMCCSSAGSYNLLQPDIATELEQRKTACIEQAGAEVVASATWLA